MKAWVRIAACGFLLLEVATLPSAASDQSHATSDPLRVCADPNNLPFSNEAQEGFENELAALFARELNRPLSYVWRPQRRGFVRNTLDAKLCDIIVGVPSDFELAQTTRPYYRSTYVFVTRTNDALDLHSLDDPRLHTLRIGLHAIGDDASNVPPAHALSARGIVQNVRGYSIYGDYSKPNPPSTLIEAVAEREIDVAIAWGPLAGYFAPRASAALTVRAVEPVENSPFPMQFSISMAVRREDRALRGQLDEVLESRRGEVRRILERYGVPLVEIEAERLPAAR